MASAKGDPVMQPETRDMLLQQVQSLRRFYPADNPYGVLLDELGQDLESGTLRDDTAAIAAVRLRSLGDPGAALVHTVRTVIAELQGVTLVEGEELP
jgi:hypothetical protein